MTLFGIDVSAHQGGGIDWSKVRGDGMTFMLARASIGTAPDSFRTSSDNRYFRRNVVGAKAAGFGLIGAYHYLENGLDGREQAKRFLGYVSDVIDPNDIALMADVEERGLTVAAYDAFVDELHRELPAHPRLTYSGRWYWDGVWSNPNRAAIGPLDASRYVSVAAGTTLPWRQAWAKVPSSWWTVTYGGWRVASILQFTSQGHVAGYGGPLDVNAFRGSMAELRGLLLPALPPTSEEEPVNVFSTPGRKTATVVAGTPHFESPGGKQTGTITDATTRFDLIGQDKATSPAYVLLDGASADPVKYPGGVLSRWVKVTALRNIAELVTTGATAEQVALAVTKAGEVAGKAAAAAVKAAADTAAAKYGA
jgi:GH25 family lysozyme M1 (1,4-beta-N-acetylmuramidase)